MHKTARIFSNALSPIFIPTYSVFMALWVSFLSFLPIGTRWAVVAVAFVITCFIPSSIIFILHKTGKISDPALNNRTERPIPYIVTILCYTAAAFYMNRIHAPMWLTMFFAGGTLAAIISLAINYRWKISAHMAAIGGMTALAFRIAANHVNIVEMDCIMYIAIILTGILGTSRIILNRHTLGQVLAGTFNGFICVYLLTMIE